MPTRPCRSNAITRVFRHDILRRRGATPPRSLRLRPFSSGVGHRGELDPLTPSRQELSVDLLHGTRAKRATGDVSARTSQHRRSPRAGGRGGGSIRTRLREPGSSITRASAAESCSCEGTTVPNLATDSRPGSHRSRASGVVESMRAARTASPPPGTYAHRPRPVAVGNARP